MALARTTQAVVGVRQVGGELVTCQVLDGEGTHVELLRRKSRGSITWRFNQPTLSLLWFRRGVDGMHLRLDGRPVHSASRGISTFALIPPSLPVDGEFDVRTYCDYAVAFFDPASIAPRMRLHFERPLIGFGHTDLALSFDRLCRAGEQPDSLFKLYLEGWAMQAVSQLARLNGLPGVEKSWRGGLSPSSLRRVREYIAEDVTKDLSNECLSRVAGVSRRHFVRAFQQSVGQTPHRFVSSLRIEKARDLLVNTTSSVSAIALDCGFSHAQHFSTNFRKATGFTPLMFRSSAR